MKVGILLSFLCNTSNEKGQKRVQAVLLGRVQRTNQFSSHLESPIKVKPLKYTCISQTCITVNGVKTQKIRTMTSDTYCEKTFHQA